MRRPTPIEALHEWYRHALRGDEPDLHNDDPQAGFYRTRLVRGGIFVGVRVWMHQEIDPETGELCDDERLRAEINGIEVEDVAESWSRFCDQPITEDEFDYLEQRRVWSLYYAPDDPAANPRRAVDWRKILPEF